jgi:uncharacterized protein YdiU (UPF0061 family)
MSIQTDAIGHSGRTAASPFALPMRAAYESLGPAFSTALPPEGVTDDPVLIHASADAGALIGLSPALFRHPSFARIFSGADPLPGFEPLAMVYSGHQFGQWAGQLGDGRALTIAQVEGPHGLVDIQLKGAGRTPYSRFGDGRAVVRSSIREYLCSEAMAALGVPTTRALAAVATGEEVFRDTPLPGAVLTRIAASHIRVGTFQYFAAQGDTPALALLVDHAIARHHPSARGPLGLLDAVVSAQARLVARWLLVGFIHGVMNTDNMTISGETIDYGPCAFLDAYDPATVLSSIDHAGRYAYANQPQVAAWNLARFAECLLPLTGREPEPAVAAAQEVLAEFGPRFRDAWRAGLAQKLGVEGPADALAQDFLGLLEQGAADFTLGFRFLADAAAGEAGPLRALFADAAPMEAWLLRWRAVLPPDAPARLRAANPAVIPRNHLVEEAIEAAVARNDLNPFETLLAAVSRPFEVPADPRLIAPPREAERVRATFCGT